MPAAIDPWDWTVEEVVDVLCYRNVTTMDVQGPPNSDRSYLESQLRKHEVNGRVMLATICDAVLRDDFGIQTLGKRGMVIQDVNILRLRSWKYSEYIGQALAYRKNPPPKPAPEVIDLTSPPRRKREPSPVDRNAPTKSRRSRGPEVSARGIPRSKVAKSSSRKLTTFFIDLTSPPKPKAPRRIELTSTEKLDKPVDTQDDLDSFSFDRRGPQQASHHFQQLASHKHIKSQLFSGHLHDEEKPSGWDKFLLTNPAQDVSKDPGIPIQEISEHIAEADALLSSDSSDDDSDTSDQLRTSGLSLEQIVSVLDAAIVEYKSKWEATKLPALQRKAAQLFGQSRGRNQARLIARDTAQLDRFRQNLAKIRKQIESDEWTSLVALKPVCAGIEVTVQNIAEYEYKLSVYSSNAPPVGALFGAPLAADIPSADTMELGGAAEDTSSRALPDALNTTYDQLKDKYDVEGMMLKILLELGPAVPRALQALFWQFPYEQCAKFIEQFLRKSHSFTLLAASAPDRVGLSNEIHASYSWAIQALTKLYMTCFDCTEKYMVGTPPVPPSFPAVERALSHVREYAPAFLQCVGRVVDHLRSLLIEPSREIIEGCIEVPVSGHALLGLHCHVIRYHHEKFIKMRGHQLGGIAFLWREMIMSAVAGEDPGCLLAHTMGLGKTAQAITFLVALFFVVSDPILACQLPRALRKESSNLRVLVVAPAGIICNWLDELDRWIPGQLRQDLFVVGFEDSSRKEDHADYVTSWRNSGGILVMSYDLLASYSRPRWQYSGISDAISAAADVVIADEAHKFKNPSTSYSQAMHKLSTPYRIALTGSPLANHLGEYYAILNWVAPSIVKKLGDFKRSYQEPIETGLRGDAQQYARNTALSLLRNLDSRIGAKVQRRGEEVLAQTLPPKREFVISIKSLDNQREIYNQLLGERAAFKSGRLLGVMSLLTVLVFHLGLYQAKLERIAIETESADPPAQAPSREADDDADPSGDTLVVKESFREFHAAHLESLRALAIPNTRYPKPTVILKLVQECLVQGDTVVIFSHWHQILDALQTWLSPLGNAVARLDGQTKPADRQALSQAVNSGQIRILLSTTRAGGVGLNLQGANRVILADATFNPVHEIQAIARTWRMGQTKPVTCYRVVAAGSFEAALHAQACFKRALALHVVDGVAPERPAVTWESLMAPLREDASGGGADAANTGLEGLRTADTVLDAVVSDPEARCFIVGVQEVDDARAASAGTAGAGASTAGVGAGGPVRPAP